MTEWISGWKKIAKHLDCSIKTAQRMAGKKVISVYQIKGSIVRADAKELDKYIRDAR